jgi:PncC family amidohydrolase
MAGGSSPGSSGFHPFVEVEDLRDSFPAATHVLARAMGPPLVTIATAESCTGGLLGAVLTAVPGSSAVYLGGMVTYSNFAKRELLGVPATALSTWGAVSAQVAAAMAFGARRELRSAIGVGITGVAGPGASSSKPAGLVYVALASAGGTRVRRVDSDRGRHRNRIGAVQLALSMLEEELGI